MVAKVSFMRGAAAYLVVISVLALSGNLIHARAAATRDDLNETIGHLLDYVANSDCAFLRNGSSYNSKEAAAHIKVKYDYFQKEIKTAEDFIRLAASKSEFSGRPWSSAKADNYARISFFFCSNSSFWISPRA